jgi:hypothetical protein
LTFREFISVLLVSSMAIRAIFVQISLQLANLLPR